VRDLQKKVISAFYKSENVKKVPYKGRPLPSASILVNMLNILTGFTYRGLHKSFGLESLARELETERLRADSVERITMSIQERAIDVQRNKCC
jgi:hypothetical protein